MGWETVRVAAREWSAGLAEVHERFLHRFSRAEPRESALAYLRGLVAPLERKNGWTLAEEAGHAGPDRIHRLLNRIDWDADEVLDDVRDYVVEHLGDPDAVLIVDDTGFLKKGVQSAGVQRQYSGTAGRTENCQVGVFLAYATGRGRTLIDRRGYLPTSWTDDRERCRRAGIDETVGFETKVVMAKTMVRRASCRFSQDRPCGLLNSVQPPRCRTATASSVWARDGSIFHAGCSRAARSRLRCCSCSASSSRIVARVSSSWYARYCSTIRSLSSRDTSGRWSGIGNSRAAAVAVRRLR
jgi:hypothetical protein